MSTRAQLMIFPHDWFEFILLYSFDPIPRISWVLALRQFLVLKFLFLKLPAFVLILLHDLLFFLHRTLTKFQLGNDYNNNHNINDLLFKLDKHFLSRFFHSSFKKKRNARSIAYINLIVLILILLLLFSVTTFECLDYSSTSSQLIYIILFYFILLSPFHISNCSDLFYVFLIDLSILSNGLGLDSSIGF